MTKFHEGPYEYLPKLKRIVGPEHDHPQDREIGVKTAPVRPTVAVMSYLNSGEAQDATGYLFAAARDLYDAAVAQEEADLAWANCPDCGGEDMPEACATCFPAQDDARVKRRLAIAKANGENHG